MPDVDDFFPDAPITIEAQVNAVKRELRYRERVYARQVSAGKMTQREATKELALMGAVLETLKGLQP